MIYIKDYVTAWKKAEKKSINIVRGIWVNCIPKTLHAKPLPKGTFSKRKENVRGVNSSLLEHSPNPKEGKTILKDSTSFPECVYITLAFGH